MKEPTLNDEELEMIEMKLVAEYHEMMNKVIQEIKRGGATVTHTKMVRARKNIAFKLLRHVTKFNLYYGKKFNGA